MHRCNSFFYCVRANIFHTNVHTCQIQNRCQWSWYCIFLMRNSANFIFIVSKRASMWVHAWYSFIHSFIHWKKSDTKKKRMEWIGIPLKWVSACVCLCACMAQFWFMKFPKFPFSIQSNSIRFDSIELTQPHTAHHIVLFCLQSVNAALRCVRARARITFNQFE